MSVSKRKVGNRLLAVLLAGLGVYLIVAFMALTAADTSTKLDNFTKTSVDDTPNFNLTEPHTQCQYVYDSVKKTVTQAKGFEHCQLPNLN